jgi:hypothetical protein
MANAIIIGLLIGLISGNSIPHFVKGITKENYPCLFGNSPIPNLFAGWLFLNITCVLIYFWNYQSFPIVSLIFCSLGLLLIGLFHAGPGAFGKKEKGAEQKK